MTNEYFLSTGSHPTPEQGRCAMEWVSFIAGEPHTDQPVCVSPVLKSFCISFNDALDDETRQRLRPYLARCIGTAGDGRDEERAWMAADWLIRVYTPTWLDLAGLPSQASNLRSLAAVISPERVQAAQPALDIARKDAAAALAAAGDAAWAAAGAAAWAAAGAAAGAAARAAARAAAGDAAGAAAWDAAWAAARAAAGAALQSTVKALQDSAFDLLDRMLPKELIELPEPVMTRAEEVCAA